VGAIAISMSNLPVLSSTLLLTLLLFVGLWFFIRASVKERIEQLELTSDRAFDALYTSLIHYFEKRAYRTIEERRDQGEIRFEGFVRPSLFLAIFLSTLAACGLFCLGLVLAYSVPTLNGWVFIILLLSPGAGIFYWRKAGRLEQVQIKITNQPEQEALVWVEGHRDELAQLKHNWGAI
jgi:hypothetical protein